MDSITQFLLGASISGAMIGPRMGRGALLLGGAVATLPDLDSFISLGNAIDQMTYHRGFSHSVLVHTILAPALAWALAKWWRAAAELGTAFYLTIWLCLVTHPLLDSLTTYGTQILWPLDIGPPVAYPSVFIIDPVYSGLLLLGFVKFVVDGRARYPSPTFIRVTLFSSILYLLIGIAGHWSVMGRAMAHEGFSAKALHVQPAPFNILLWQVLAADDTSFQTALTGIFPGCPLVPQTRNPRQPVPPDGLPVTPADRRLEWFTDGFYSYGRDGEAIVLTDLRLGYPPNFIFSFLIGRGYGAAVQAVDPARLPLREPRMQALARAWESMKAAAKACF